MLHRSGPDGNRFAMKESGKGGEHGFKFPRLSSRDQSPVFVVDAPEDLTMKEIGDRQNPLPAASRRKGRDIRRERPQARPLARESSDAREGYAEAGERSRPGDGRENRHIPGGEAGFGENRVHRGEEFLRVAVIRLKRFGA